MKSKEVLELLRVSRATLTSYVKNGYIKVHTKPNGQYEYDDESVYKFFNKNINRKTVIYASRSNNYSLECDDEINKIKEDVNKQIELLKKYCYENGYKISIIYKDSEEIFSFKDKKEFIKLLNEVMDKKIEKIIVFSKDNLYGIKSNFVDEILEVIFKKFACEIIFLN